jgi:magnesium-transporting ATPase (P-type)
MNEIYSGNKESDWSSLKGRIECEQPNNAIYKYEGFLTMDGTNLPLDVDQLLLRGCKLRNTGFAIGVIVFTGSDTKIMKNTAQAKYKFSTLELMSNQSIALVLATQFIIALLASSVGTSWQFQNDVIDSKTKLQPAYYISAPVSEKEEGFFTVLILGSLTWVMIFTNMVPISLMVQLEICKLA